MKGRKDTMKAARLHAVGNFTVDKVAIPVPQGKELLVKIGACGVCGSDIPRIYRHGTSNQRYPLTLGHEFAGTIVAVGEDADSALIGKRGGFYPLIPCMKCRSCQSGHYAMCEDYDYMGSRRDGGFAEYCLVPDAWNFVESRNPDTTMQALAMLEPACVAQHAVRKSGIFAGANVLIFGAGPIGLMAGRWAKLAGARHILFSDTVPAKIDFARKLGFDAANAAEDSFNDRVRRCFDGEAADIAIEGTGYGSALNQAIECCKAFGHITLLGNPAGDTAISRHCHSLLLRKEITVAGIWNSHYADIPLNEWKHTVYMMDQGLFTCDDLVSHTSSLDDLPSLIAAIYDRSIVSWKALCTVS